MDLTAPGADDGYSGQARLTIGEAQFDVQVELRGHFEPIDGRYHWYGRIARDDSLAERLGGGKVAGMLQTEQGSSPCEVGEPDAWHRYRITGYSTPPFRLATPGLT